MSFGYSVGDFFTVVQFAWNTYEKCRASTSFFKDLGRDVGNAHLVLRNIHRFWQKEKDNNHDLLVPQQEELKHLADHCLGALKDVEQIRQKHGELETDGSVRARLKYVVRDAIHDFGSIREKLQQSTGNLALYHTMLTAEALYEASGDHRDILLTLKGQSDVIKVFVSSYQQFQEGKRPEPAYSQTAKTATRESRDQQEQRTIEAAEAELRAEGLDPSIIFQHRDLIKEWLDTVILAPTADEEDDEATVAEDSSSIVGADERISEAVLGLRLEQNDVGGSDFTGDGPHHEKRSGSVSTDRSQSSRWESPEADKIADYAAAMVAKVLSSKYPPESGNDPFQLPIKKAFYHLDYTNRGWLPRAEVEQQCSIAAFKLGWTFSPSEIARIVKTEDAKEGNPDYHIDFQEFFDIVLAVRNEVYSATKLSSSKRGLQSAAAVLKDWCSGNEKEMLSGRWTQQRRYKENPKLIGVRILAADSPVYLAFVTYSHQFSGDIAEGSIPLNFNFTNAVYLATRCCLPEMNYALASWRTSLKNWPSKERGEIFEALNSVIDSATNFYMLEAGHGFHTYHQLDSLLEDVHVIPLTLFEDLRDCPSQALAELLVQCWTLLSQILGFVSDLNLPHANERDQRTVPGVMPPKITTWRRHRMVDRSREISSAAATLRDSSSTIKKVEIWCGQHQSVLVTHSEECISCAKRLKEEQEQVDARDSTEPVYIDNIKLGKILHIPLRPPSTSLKIYVDGKGEINCYVAGKTSTPVWTSFPIIVKRSSSVRFDFYSCSYDRRYDNVVHHESKNFLGSVVFNVRDVVDFERMATVHVRRTLQACTSKKVSKPELTFDITPMKWKRHVPGSPPPLSETEWQKVAREKSELALAVYIIRHPIPEGWEIRRSDGNKIYFFNKRTSEPTAILWYDPLYSHAPQAKLKPLPEGWKRIVKGGQTWYKSPLDELTREVPSANHAPTFENVLEPIQYHSPEAFHVN